MEVVSFEIAKKLKEKGFRERTLSMYLESVKLPHTPLIYYLKDWNKEDNCYSAPTISQVLKWLREEKKIFIDIRTSIDLNGKEHFSYYIIYNKVSIREGYTDFDWKFEQAALAGIEYVLDNLI